MNMHSLRAGLFFLAVGAVLGVISYDTMALGNLARMGPGFFPVVLCALLMLLGGGMVLQGVMGSKRERPQYAPIRAIMLIGVAPIAFGLMVRPVGLVVSLFVTAMIATLARSDGRLASNLLIAAGLTALCVAIFGYGIGLAVPLLPQI